MLKCKYNEYNTESSLNGRCRFDCIYIYNNKGLIKLISNSIQALERISFLNLVSMLKENNRFISGASVLPINFHRISTRRKNRTKLSSRPRASQADRVSIQMPSLEAGYQASNYEGLDFSSDFFSFA